MLTVRASTIEAREQMKREIEKMERFFPGLPRLATKESGKCRDAVQVLILSCHDVKRCLENSPPQLQEGDLVQLSEDHERYAHAGPLQPGDLGKVRGVAKTAIAVKTFEGQEWEYDRAENLQVVRLLSSKNVSLGSAVTLDRDKGAALPDCPLKYGAIGKVESVHGRKVRVRKESREKGKEREEWVYDDETALTAGQGLPAQVGRKVTVVRGFEAKGNAGQGPLRELEWGHVLEITRAVLVRLPDGSDWLCEDHNLLRIVAPATDTKTVLGRGGAPVEVRVPQEVKVGRLVRLGGAPPADAGNAPSGPFRPGEGFAEVAATRPLEWWVEFRGKAWAYSYPGALQVVSVPQEPDIFGCLRAGRPPFPLSEDPASAQLALALRRLGPGLLVDLESPGRPCWAEARIVLVCMEEEARGSGGFLRLLRAHALRSRAIIPVIMPGFLLGSGSRPGEWWPESMPELREHALFVDLRERADWDSVVAEQLLPQVEKFLDEWRGDAADGGGGGGGGGGAAAAAARVECLECVRSDVPEPAAFDRADLVREMNRWMQVSRAPDRAHARMRTGG